MKKEIIRFFKMWTLPLGMLAGVGIYLMFHYIPLLSPLKVLAKGQRISSCRLLNPVNWTMVAAIAACMAAVAATLALFVSCLSAA